MNRLLKLYFHPLIAALLIALLLIWWFFPSSEYGKVIIVVLLSLATLTVGFHIATHKRIQAFRKQLQQIIQTLEKFDIDEPNKVVFEKSPFPVFNELKDYLQELIARIRTDYLANKQFTQNASHELQTPLAIIKGHIELLLQSPNLGEKEMKALGAILQNTNRLSKLNSALILLSKIENQRFTDTETVSLNKTLEEVLLNFQDLLQIQDLEIRKDYQSTFNHGMSATLAEILLANLVQNAIRHNTGDYIEISITNSQIQIANPGQEPRMTTQNLFKRFKRQSDKEESLGLGLSIVKRICEVSGLRVDYDFLNGVHILTIKKNTD